MHTTDQETSKEINRKLSAIVALLAAYMNADTQDRFHVESILQDVGFTPTEIAKMIGKKPDTVIKILKRLNKNNG